MAESWRRSDPVPAFVASWALLAIGANDGEAGGRIIASAPQLADRVDGLTSMAQVCGRGLGLFGAGVLAWNVLKRRPPSTDHSALGTASNVPCCAKLVKVLKRDHADGIDFRGGTHKRCGR